MLCVTPVALRRQVKKLQPQLRDLLTFPPRSCLFSLFPHCRDFTSLTEEDPAGNLQLAFDVGQREFGVAPFTSGQELSAAAQDVDKTQMILYLSKFYELFRGTPLPQTGTSTPVAPPHHRNHIMFACHTYQD